MASGLWKGTTSLWGGTSGLWKGISGLWSGASGFQDGSGTAPPPPSFTVSFNFILNEVLDPRITATGGAGATRVNSAGIIVAQGAPRFDYDPVTKAARGLLCEQSATNLALQSGAFSNAAGWARSSATFTGTPATAPNGAANGDHLTEAVGAGIHLVRQTITTVAATVYTASMYFKTDTRTNIMITLDDGVTAFATAKFNGTAISANAVTGTGATATIVAAGNNWMRVTLTAPAAGATTRFTPTLLDAAFANNYTGDGTSGLFVWGGQFEAGAFATSYVPTTTVAVTRTMDVLIASGAGFSWFIDGADFTMVAQWVLPYIDTVGALPIFGIDDNGTTNLFRMREGTVIGGTDLYVVASNTPQVDTGALPTPVMLVHGGAAGISAGLSNYAVDGALAGADIGPITFPVGMVRLVINAGGYATKWMRGWAYTPSRLTNAQLVTLSAATTPPPALTGFDPNFNPALTYTVADLIATRTDSVGRRALRGSTGYLDGKRYAEFEVLTARLRFLGVVDTSFNLIGAGGPAGTNRVGIEANRLIGYPSVSHAAGGFANAGDIVRVAWDADAKRLWVKRNGGNWNNSSVADPSTGVGGLSTEGLLGAGFLGATLRPVNGAGLLYRTDADPGYTLPEDMIRGYERA